ncbi:hypothetical protein [Roseibium alexandrii]|uniref:Uncharacterized protein n=1 Tax=Roseibium alexandrii TaxID=388408 RepID=A0A0M6ZXY0_9HYPH|nr:hypothetical protein [Roseibium alexandrii]CTQ67147.1 hypothetical protein LAX5112_01233 [Roseibium alexandrii]
MRKSLIVAAPAAVWPSFQVMALPLGYVAGDGIEILKDGVEWRVVLDSAATARVVGVLSGQIVPDDTEEFTSAQFAAAIGQCLVSVDGMTPAEIAALGPDDPRPILRGKAHFEAVLAKHGFTIQETPLD